MFADSTMHGDCSEVMRGMPARSTDFILTDPPYLINYRPCKNNAGQTVANDDNHAWLKPSAAQMHRVLKENAPAISFYGWHCVDLFMEAWKAAGFRPVGHIVFRKAYASSARFVGHRHEAAYLLAKGQPPFPQRPPPDVIDWVYTGNLLHPTQKPVAILMPLIHAFTPAHGIVLDPFAGSGSTLVAARKTGRRFIGIELDETHHRTATARLAKIPSETGSMAA